MAYILNLSIGLSLIHLHGFQLLVRLQELIEVTSFVTSNKLVIVAKGILKLTNLLMFINQKVSFLRKLVLTTFDKLLIVFVTKVNLL